MNLNLEDLKKEICSYLDEEGCLRLNSFWQFDKYSRNEICFEIRGLLYGLYLAGLIDFDVLFDDLLPKLHTCCYEVVL